MREVVNTVVGSAVLRFQDFQDRIEVNGGASQLSVARWEISHGQPQCRHPTHVPASSTRSIVADRKRNLRIF